MKVIVTVFALCLLAVSSSLWAKTGIDATYPANDDVIGHSPEQLEFVFKNEVRLMQISLTDTQNKAIRVAFKPASKAKKGFKVQIPSLSLGTYQVKWISMERNGRKTKGAFSFMIHESHMGTL